jgi:2-iminobutanoate/2-iminopropanoate deaminase
MSAKREGISSDSAPEAVGPYSQAVCAGDFLFCSGQLPLDPQSGEIVSGDLARQTSRCLLNLEAVCLEAGCSLADAVKINIYTTRLDGFSEINRAYEEYFSGDLPPARAAVGVAELPLGAAIEIDATVVLA